MMKPDDVLRTFVSLQAMKELRRQGAIFYGERMMEADTIAGHSFTMTCLAWFIAEAFKQEACGADIDVGRVLRMGLCHDMGEAITGDIPAPFKRKAKEMGMGDTLEEAELEAFKDLVKPLDSLNMELPKILAEYDEMKTKEAGIVKVADRLDAFVHALATISVHNLIQAWGFYNSRLHNQLGQRGQKCEDPKDMHFWQSLAEWFKTACRRLGGEEGLCPLIPPEEQAYADREWLPKCHKTVAKEEIISSCVATLSRRASTLPDR
jgi:putative hydrolase of HD superfamily